METRNLGASGLKISAIAYGNWLTHGSQVEEDAALACVHQALEEGITTFDTADVYANTAAETVLGKALAGERREGLEIFTKVYFPTGPGGPNDSGLSRKHIRESIEGSLRRLGTDHVDLYQAHRYDYETPLEETMEAFADVVHAGKAHYVGVSEWTADQIREAHALARELRIPLVSNQPQYNMLWRVIEAEVVPACEELGIGQIVWSPIAQGVLTGKYQPGQAPPTGSRATDEKGGADMVKRFLEDDTLTRVQRLAPVAEEAGLSMAQLAIAWVLQNTNVSAAIIGASRPEQVTENVRAGGVTLPPEAMKAIDEAFDGIVERDPAKTTSALPRLLGAGVGVELDHAAAQEMYAAYIDALPEGGAGVAPEPAAIECFGDSPELAEELIAFVTGGSKRATAALVAEFAAEDEPLPRIGDHWVACGGDGAPVAVLRTRELRLGPLSSVDADFAWDEGEHDRTLVSWLQGHRRYFARSCERLGIGFSDDIEVVFERFSVVWPPGLADGR